MWLSSLMYTSVVRSFSEGRDPGPSREMFIVPEGVVLGCEGVILGRVDMPDIKPVKVESCTLFLVASTRKANSIRPQDCARHRGEGRGEPYPLSVIHTSR